MSFQDFISFPGPPNCKNHVFLSNLLACSDKNRKQTTKNKPHARPAGLSPSAYLPATSSQSNCCNLNLPQERLLSAEYPLPPRNDKNVNKTRVVYFRRLVLHSFWLEEKNVLIQTRQKWFSRLMVIDESEIYWTARPLPPIHDPIRILIQPLSPLDIYFLEIFSKKNSWFLLYLHMEIKGPPRRNKTDIYIRKRIIYHEIWWWSSLSEQGENAQGGFFFWQKIKTSFYLTQIPYINHW